MPKASSPADHEAAGRYLATAELCHDLAREHVTLDERMRHEEIALLLYCGRSGVTRVASLLARRLMLARARRANRFKEIALLLYRRRAKARSPLQQVRANEVLDQILKSRKEEGRLEADLLGVFHDPHYSLERRRAARLELEEFRKAWEKREPQQLLELVTASSATKHHPSISRRLILRFRRDGRDKFFDRLDLILRRYLRATVGGERWAASMPLLRLLASEWLHDAEALWRFLEACFNRWQMGADPKSEHYQDQIMHNVCETKMALDRDGKNVIDPTQKILPQVAVWLQRTGAVGGNQSAICDRLRKRSSRNISKAKASGIKISVTMS